MSIKNDLRRNQIQEYIKEVHNVTVEELSHKYHVSLETIRKDLSFLEQKGKLYRTHGGAMYRSENYDIPMDIRSQENIHLKKAISSEAINYINDDDFIYLDASSTVLHLGYLLKTKKNLTIVTNSYELIPILAQSNHRILLIGGEFLRNGKRIIGDFAIKMLHSIYFDWCVFGMDGCKGLDGPALMSSDEIFIFQTVVERSKQSMLLCDHTKFQKFAHYQYADFSQFNILISNYISKEDIGRINVEKIISLEENPDE